MMEKFGDHLVCMDSTHGLNSYEFELTTFLVVDDRYEGFPGGFMFSNRVDAEVTQIF